MKLAFYLAKYGNYTDKIISYWTLGKYSHVEIVFSNKEWFSSSTRDGGTRFKKIGHSDRWDYIQIPCDFHTEKQIYRWCETQVGKQYDWIGAFRIGFGISGNNDQWYCSEICSNALMRENLICFKSDQMSPNKMFKEVKRKLLPCNTQTSL